MSSSRVGEIIFGNGCRKKVTGLLRDGNTLLICGKHSETMLRDEVVPQIQSVSDKVVLAVVSPEIPLAEVKSIAFTAREINARNIIGWGGGSAMDAAKAVSAVCCAPDKCEEFFYCRETPPLRDNNLILVTTTAGTGAEVTPNAVLLDTATGIKQSLRAPGMFADAALIDPELLYDAPQQVIANGAFDALTQALEGFVSNRATAYTRQLSLTAAALILPAILPGCSGDKEALTALSRGTMLGAIAFVESGLGAVHGIAHPLGSVLHLGHGLCCGILLDKIMEFNSARVPGVFDELARGLDFADAGEMINHIRWVRRGAGLPESLEQYGFDKKDFDFIVANCRSGSMKCNPVYMEDSDVCTILEKLL